MNQGAARVLIEATLKDTSGHNESRGEPVTVSFPPDAVLRLDDADDADGEGR